MGFSRKSRTVSCHDAHQIVSRARSLILASARTLEGARSWRVERIAVDFTLGSLSVVLSASRARYEPDGLRGPFFRLKRVYAAFEGSFRYYRTLDHRTGSVIQSDTAPKIRFSATVREEPRLEISLA